MLLTTIPSTRAPIASRISRASTAWGRPFLWIRTVSNTLSVIGEAKPARYGLEIGDGATVSCGDVVISGASFALGSSGCVSGPSLNVANDVTLTNAGVLRVYAGLTHAGTTVEYGSRVTVGGDVVVPSSCVVYPAAHPTNGAVVLFNMRNLTIESGGAFNADTLGFGGGPRGVPASAQGTAPYGDGLSVYNGGGGDGGAGSGGDLNDGRHGESVQSSNERFGVAIDWQPRIESESSAR